MRDDHSIVQLDNGDEPQALQSLSFLPVGAYNDIAERSMSSLRSIVLFTSNQCNLRCTYCVFSGSYRSHRLHGRESMTPLVARGALQFFKDHSYGTPEEERHLGFYGGEPLLNLSLLDTCGDLFRHFSPNGTISLTTNGTLLDRRAVRTVTRLDAQLTVSLDGPAIIHDRYRRDREGGQTYSVIRKNLKRLQEYDPEYYRNQVRFNIVAAPPLYLRVLDEFFQNNPETFPSFELSGVQPGSPLGDMPQPDLVSRDYRAISKRYVADVIRNIPPTQMGRALFDRPLQKLHHLFNIPLPANHIPLNATCTPGIDRLLVDIDGEFRVCQQMESGPRIGDFVRGIDARIVEQLQTSYERVAATDCQTCWAARLCTLCFKDLFDGMRVAPEKRNRRCIQEQNDLRELLSLYVRILEARPSAFTSRPFAKQSARVQGRQNEMHSI